MTYRTSVSSGRLALLAATAILFVATAVARTPKQKQAETAPSGTGVENVDSLNSAVATVMASSLSPIISNLKDAGLDVDAEKIGRYISYILSGNTPIMESTQANAYVDSLLHLNMRNAADTVPEAGQRAFLEKAAARPGAVVTPSGLVFEVLVEGEGISPAADDRVAVQYQGRFSDGSLFDDTGSDKVVFNLDTEIPGFVEGLRMMKPGGTYRLTIPAGLAYGREGIPGIIPGNAALEFTVTLDSILPAD